MEKPKHQKIVYWYKEVNGGINDFLSRYTNDGWVAISISMSSLDTAYLLLHKYN